MRLINVLLNMSSSLNEDIIIIIFYTCSQQSESAD